MAVTHWVGGDDLVNVLVYKSVTGGDTERVGGRFDIANGGWGGVVHGAHRVDVNGAGGRSAGSRSDRLVEDGEDVISFGRESVERESVVGKLTLNHSDLSSNVVLD